MGWDVRPGLAGSGIGARGAVRLAVGLAALTFVALPGRAEAQQPCANPVAVFESVQNSVQILQVSTRALSPAVQRVAVCAGDTIRVGDNSRAVIVILGSNTPLAIDQNTEFVVGAPVSDMCRPPEGGSIINLIRGALLYLSRVHRSTVICTRFANASIEGTEFVIRVETDRTVVTVFEGAVRAANEYGAVLAGPGQQAVAVQGQAPQVQVVVRPRDAVQWALYYEPVLPGDSFQQLAAIPDADRNARFYVRRAALQINVGQLESARADLAQANMLDPSNSDVYVLQTVVAVALNDKAAALENGRQAVSRAPESAAARIALSYALQANLQLEEARSAVEQAVRAQDGNGVAWARLAELRLMLDDVRGANEAAERAVMLSPQVARAQVVRGFTQLAKLDTADAQAAFEEAVRLASDNPLARLGLGLTKIRRGHLAEGRADLEVAAALNPDDPIIRSYLGKAYFDEKRDALTSSQLEEAKKLDPSESTAFYYDAILKQTQNRPVEALLDFERATELNGNRAVYRSRFQLDQDLAARSASVGRLYRDLGYEQLALVEAWKSIDAEPMDYPGHRLLADAYSVLPRHEVARVSELLQAQLLEPLSLTPVSPRLAETDLFILDRAGPDRPSFNEFNPLFNRNRFVAQVSGAVGGRGTLGDELMVGGIWNRVSFSAGQFHYEADGFRENNQQDRDIGNAFVQVQLSSSTSVQAEVRADDSQAGDLALLFGKDNFDPDYHANASGKVVRVGLRHVFSPASQLIASAYYGQRNSDIATQTIFGDQIFAASTITDTDSWTFEVRHLLRAGPWRLTTGAGRFQASQTRTEGFASGEGTLPDTGTELVFKDDPGQTNVYAYAGLNLPKRVTLTAGGSADFYRSLLFDRSQFNPKFGVTWNPWPQTTVRATAFRTLHRALVSSQTIEPTQVAGFNQFFEDPVGTDAYRYGVAVDQRAGSRVAVGGEYSWRNLSVPVQVFLAIQRFDQSEQFGRSYLYWSLSTNFALTADARLERFDRADFSSLTENFLELTTQRASVGLRYFSSLGWSANVVATAIGQSGRFPTGFGVTSGDAQFGVVDLSAGYRLPRRIGRLSLEIKNLFDAQFNFQDTDPGNPTIKPGRLVVFLFTVGR